MCFLAICYCIIPFLDEYTVDPMFKYDMGFLPMAISLLYLFVNLAFIVWETFKTFREKLRSKIRLSKRNVNLNYLEI